MPKLDHNRVAIYIRVSTTHQVDKDSLPMQRSDLTAYAKLMLATEDYVIFEDAGYSGKNTDRPRYQEMMSQIRTGTFTHLLVWKIDRISRNLLDFAEMYSELKKLGVIFVSKSEQFDTGTAMGEAMLKIILVFAELERNMTSERVQATMLSRANQGLWNGGRVPFGYSYDAGTGEFSFRDGEHQLAVLIHDKYEEFHSLVKEARYLNDRGFRTRAGNTWNPVSLRIILRSLFYCGDYQYNRLKEGDRQQKKDVSEWVTVQSHHAAMVSREQKDRIIKILDSNVKTCVEKNLYREPDKIHIFGGIVYCACCGRQMYSSSIYKKDHWRYSRYTCPSKRKFSAVCKNQSVTDLAVGETVFNCILNLLNAQKIFSAIKNEKELEKAIMASNAFPHAAGIDQACVHDIYSVLQAGVEGGVIYGKGMTVKEQAKPRQDEADSLKKDKARIERALDRLRDLYLFDESAMSEAEYIVKRQELIERLDEVNEEIGMLNSDEWFDSISDQEFMQKAAEFLISQNLAGRHYVKYERLAREAGPEALQMFVATVIDSIAILHGKVTSIVFRNGLSIKIISKD